MIRHGHSMVTRWFVMGCVAAVLATASAGAAASFSSISVFGDSLSDGGNDFIYTGGNFPPAPYAQRFSNGPTAVEVLAGSLKLALTPSLAGGSNYAYGGAETGTGNYLAVKPDLPAAINALFSGPPTFPATGTLAQVQSFGGSFGAQSLVVLWSGPNDLFTALTLGNNLMSTLMTAMDNLAQSVGLLYFSGARHILMPNMPDIGSTPFGLGSGDAAGLTAYSQIFNFNLAQLIGQLESLLSGLDIVEFDTYGLLARVEADPAAFGLSNVTDAYIECSAACGDPDQYLFWDSVHPTASGHRILGAGFYAAVPEPGTLLLIGLALLSLAVSRRCIPAATRRMPIA